jgi:hypothetical protein
MPPSEPKSSDEWIASDQLCKITLQDLLPEEAGRFLKYLFSSIGRRPKRIGLREGAAVARYLKLLAWESAAGPGRQLLERLSQVIWGTVLQFGQFSMSSQQEAAAFLESHAHTYLAAFDVAAAVKLVRKARPPVGNTQGLPAPNLLSMHSVAQGTPTPQRQDDLSERIYAGYYALRRARIHNARRRIAATLNQLGLMTRARSETWREWGSYEVIERVKQFEARWLRRNPRQDDTVVKKWRDAVVDCWITRFRAHEAIAVTARTEDAPSKSI